MLQEEYLLSSAIALAVSVLLGSLTAGNSQDYVFAGYFLICASSFLKLNWLRGALPQLLPLFVAKLRCRALPISAVTEHFDPRSSDQQILKPTEDLQVNGQRWVKIAALLRPAELPHVWPLPQLSSSGRAANPSLLNRLQAASACPSAEAPSDASSMNVLPDCDSVCSGARHVLPKDAPVHIFVAWAVGTALAFLAESYRR